MMTERLSFALEALDPRHHRADKHGQDEDRGRDSFVHTMEPFAKRTWGIIVIAA